MYSSWLVPTAASTARIWSASCASVVAWDTHNASRGSCPGARSSVTPRLPTAAASNAKSASRVLTCETSAIRSASDGYSTASVPGVSLRRCATSPGQSVIAPRSSTPCSRSSPRSVVSISGSSTFSVRSAVLSVTLFLFRPTDAFLYHL